MVTVRNITDAVNAAMVKAFPGAQAHVDTCQEDFSRPAYLIALKKTSHSDVNKSTQSVQTVIAVTFFAPLNDKGVCDRDALHDAQDKILHIFAAGSLPVGDRHLKVAAAAQDGLEGSTAVATTFAYFDDRGIAAENLPMMGAVETAFKEA